MNTILLTSYFALWLVVLLLIFAVFVLARQIGFMHERIAPSGARMIDAGLEVGQVVPARRVTDIEGRNVDFGGIMPKPILITFLSATCGSCADVAPALRSLWKNERRRISFLIISVSGSEEENQRFIDHFDLGDIPYVLSHDLGMAFKVVSPPYGIFLDDRGIVKAKGIVNRLEHLESLLNAAELNEPSVESYMAKRKAEVSLNLGANDIGVVPAGNHNGD